jgi:signal-transduction protein with cAMP-binding, CBS, and nucleotidyltransferase domain
MACKVTEFIDRSVVTMDCNSTVRAAAEAMVSQNTGSMVVLDSGRVAGFFTERDLLSRVVAKGHDANEISLKEVITCDLITISYDSSCKEALELMKKNTCRHLLAYDNQTFIGVLSIRDLAQGVGEKHAARDLVVNLLGGLTMILAIGIIALLASQVPKMFEVVRRVVE